jgi:outer membrane protein assembly factor BamB
VTGLAFATDGTLLAVVGPGQAAAGGYANAIVALDPKTLQLKDWFTDSKTQFGSAPLVFKTRDKEVVAAAATDGRVLLLDVKSLGGASHATPLFASRPLAASGAPFAPGALAMWQEMTPAAAPTSAAPAAAAPSPAAQAPPPQGAPPPGVPQGPLTTLQGAPGTPAGAPPAGAGSATASGPQWLLVPVNGALPAEAGFPNSTGSKSGAIVALKVVEDGGRLSLQPGWVSGDLAAPATPLIVNGVVFALSSGRPQPSGGAAGKGGSPAVLHAFNGTDGKPLWSSGKTITSPLSGRSFWSATGQVYVGTLDGTLYAFGPAMDRR